MISKTIKELMFKDLKKVLPEFNDKQIQILMRRYKALFVLFNKIHLAYSLDKFKKDKS